MVDRNGPRPLHVPTVPEHCEELILRVKMYERAAIRAALTCRREDRIAALQLNPLVSDRAQVPALVDALMAS